MQVRTPAVAGMFYPNTKQQLKSSIRDCFLHKYGPGKQQFASDKKIIGVISPHAGYEYSGPIAANSYQAISTQNPQLVIIIGPNHWGIGKDVAVMKDGTWQTPLGDVEVDSESATQIAKISKTVTLDYFSHTRDHSLEVQVPMLQETFSHKFKILPIILIDQSKDTAIEIGKAIAKIAAGRDIIIIGSSDFTHYEPNELAHRQDKFLIDSIISMDIEEFYMTLQEKKVSACGYGAIATTMIACKELGATRASLLRYATSGDITGDESSVVGYASIAFS